MQVLADLVTEERKAKTLIVATVGSLQPHLPQPEVFKSFCNAKKSQN
jgi:transcription-repair coupling factor (superfamily II helicase)